MDRGMGSRDNVAFLCEPQRRYIIGTPKARWKQFERVMFSADWTRAHDGLEVQLCPAADGGETFILCRSAERMEKERAMQDRFEMRIEEGLAKIAATANKRRRRNCLRHG